MARLIDADILMIDIGCVDAVKYGNETAEQQHNSYSTLMMYEIADYINDAETIDAEPVRHGRWVKHKAYVKTAKCSECKTDFTKLVISDEYPNYCPNCGAKMDLEEE